MLYRNTFCALALLCFCGSAAALDLGFEGLIAVNVSDNVGGANAGDEAEGQVGYGQFGVFGEQKGDTVRGAFSGEIYSQRQLNDSDDEFSGITQFIGAAEWNITPRSFSWYVGDILGGVRTDDAFQPIDDSNGTRRNVFVTGPRFVYELDSFSRVDARLLYVNQSQDNTQLESLYNSTASWEFDTDRGNTWGLLFADIFTDNPENVSDDPDAIEGDFNRITLAGYWKRDRGRNAYQVQLGGTRYDTDEESVNGANAEFIYNRQLGSQSSFSFSLTRDLRDQTLTTIETLFEDGTGVAPNGDGFFDETRLDLAYKIKSENSIFDVSVGAGQSDFRLLNGTSANGDLADRNNFYASTNFSYAFTPRTSVETALSYEKQDFINRVDNSQSLVGAVQFAYQLTRSFELQAGYRGSASDGETSRNQTDAEAPTELIDIIENRLILGLRWAPPTRASKDLTIELKSLLQ